MVEQIQSAWWIVFYIDKKDNAPRFLVIKRYALSKKIEWVAPKGKIEKWELPEQTAIRETSEETWLDINGLTSLWKLGDINLSFQSDTKASFDKSISYYLLRFNSDPTKIKIIDSEWYLWIHKWATIQEVLWLVYYENLREIFRKAYWMITDLNK